MLENQAKPTVIHVSHAEIRSGLASTIHVMEVAENLRRLGYPIHLLARKVDKNSVDFSHTVPSYVPIKGFGTASFSMSSAIRLYKLIKARHPAVVYYRRALVNPFPAWIAHRLNTPLLTELNEPWEAHLSETRPEWFWRMLIGWVEKTTFSKSTAVLCPSETMKNLLAARYPQFSSKFRVVYHGVDADLFRPISEEEAQKTIGLAPGEYLLWAGTPFWWSGMEFLRNLGHILRQKRPSCKILFVGDEKKAEAFKSGPWPENILCIGKSGYERMPLYYCAARGLLAPYSPLYLKDRGFPFKVLEALSCERPVLITKEKVSEEMAQLIGGVTLLPEEIGPWVEECLKILSDPTLAQQRGKEAREGIRRSRLTWHHAVTQIHEIIEETLL